MRGRVAKPRKSRSLRSFRLSQEQLLGSGAELSPGHSGQQPPVRRGPAQKATPFPAYTRTTDTLRAVDIQQPKVEDREAEEVAQFAQTSRGTPTLRDASLYVPRARGQEQQEIGGGGDGDKNQTHLQQAPLTRENLALFNKRAGRKGTDTAAPSSLSDSVTEKTKPFTRTMSTLSTMASSFAVRVKANGILDQHSSRPPANLEDLRRRYAESCGTASPTESTFKDYVDEVWYAPNEATMVGAGRHLLRKYPIKEGYHCVFDHAFTGLPKNIGINNDLSAPQPDYIQGLELEKFSPFPINDYLDGANLYKSNPRSLALSHLAGEWKGLGKNMIEAGLQSAYNGASLVYARNQALSYLGKPDPPGHAHVVTFTTDGMSLHLFAHYAMPSPKSGRLEYHQYPVDSIFLTRSYQDFKNGRKGLRNAQDYARQQSYALRDQLKGHWQEQQQHRGAL